MTESYMEKLFDNWAWHPPSHWTRITTIEMHAGGEPLRVLISGLPQIEGRTVLEKRRYFSEHYDHIRKGLMWEPRGHADMYGAVVTASRDADFDVFFLHNEGYSTMCGHAIIALTTLAVESGLILQNASKNTDSREVELTFNVPAGLIKASARVENNRAHDVRFRNVPSFLCLREGEVTVAGIGRVRFDIAYGGAFYVIVDASSVGLELTPRNSDLLI